MMSALLHLMLKHPVSQLTVLRNWQGGGVEEEVEDEDQDEGEAAGVDRGQEVGLVAQDLEADWKLMGPGYSCCRTEMIRWGEESRYIYLMT